MDILLIMLLIWGYNERPKDVKQEEPPIQETVVPDNAVDVVQVTQTAAVLTAVAEALTGTNTSTTSTEEAIIDELNTTTVTATSTTTSSTSTSSSTST